MVGVFYMVLQKVKVLSGVSCLFGQILNCHSIFISHIIIVIINLQRFVQSQDMHNQQELFTLFVGMTKIRHRNNAFSVQIL